MKQKHDERGTGKGMKKYRYIGLEHLFRAGDGRLHALQIESPILYSTSDAAQKDETCCRFVKRGGNIYIAVFRNEWQIETAGPNGIKRLRPVPAGGPVAEIDEETFKKNRRNQIKRYVPPHERSAAATDEFERVETCFDELFPDLEEGETVAVSRSDTYWVRGE